MPRPVTRAPAAVWRMFCLALAIAGFGGSLYYLFTSRVPLVLAFVHVGVVDRESSPVWFWLFVASGLVVGSLGLWGFFGGPGPRRGKEDV